MVLVGERCVNWVYVQDADYGLLGFVIGGCGCGGHGGLFVWIYSFNGKFDLSWEEKNGWTERRTVESVEGVWAI